MIDSGLAEERRYLSNYTRTLNKGEALVEFPGNYEEILAVTESDFILRASVIIACRNTYNL